MIAMQWRIRMPRDVFMRMPLPTPKTIVFALIGAILGLHIVRITLADQLAFFRPEIAVRLDSSNSTAWASQAEALLRSPTPQIEQAEAAARQALEHDPMAPGAFRALSRISELRGDVEAAERLMRVAVRGAPRRLDSQIWLFNRELQTGHLTDAIDRLDLMFRTQSANDLSRLIDASIPVITPATIGRIGYVLGQSPAWRAGFLQGAVNGVKDSSLLIQLFTDLQATAFPPDVSELRPLLKRLVQEYRGGDAYRIWRRSLPPDKNDERFLHNADFRFGVSNLPFDWVFDARPGFLMRVIDAGDRNVLEVGFFGSRSEFSNVSHLLMLPPGSYLFTGREMARLLAERGVRWRISCAGGGRETLGETRLLDRDVEWRSFELDFEIPEGCDVQELRLEIPARSPLEREARGVAQYTDLSIKGR